MIHSLGGTSSGVNFIRASITHSVALDLKICSYEMKRSFSDREEDSCQNEHISSASDQRYNASMLDSHHEP